MDDWLTSIKLDRYAAATKDAGYDELDFLLAADETDILEMTTDVGMKKPHAKAFLVAWNKLKLGGSPAAAAAAAAAAPPWLPSRRPSPSRSPRSPSRSPSRRTRLSCAPRRRRPRPGSSAPSRWRSTGPPTCGARRRLSPS
eukprot:SAG22_NODE_1017_length_6016_cov_40.662667_11_plen_141_part_00